MSVGRTLDVRQAPGSPLRLLHLSQFAGNRGRGIDYVDRRNGLIAAVTIEDVRQAARRLFASGDLTVVRVGPPES